MGRELQFESSSPTRTLQSESSLARLIALSEPPPPDISHLQQPPTPTRGIQSYITLLHILSLSEGAGGPILTDRKVQ